MQRIGASVSAAMPADQLHDKLLPWQATFAVTLGGVNIVDFNAQRQAAFLQVIAGFMGVLQSTLKISSIGGLPYNSRCEQNRVANTRLPKLGRQNTLHANVSTALC